MEMKTMNKVSPGDGNVVPYDIIQEAPTVSWWALLSLRLPAGYSICDIHVRTLGLSCNLSEKLFN